MSNNIVIGRYYPLNSLIHKMNSVSKVLSIFLFSLTSLITNNIYIHIFLTILTIVMVLLTKIPIKTYLKMVKSLRFIIIFIVLINIIFKVEILTTFIIILKLITIVIYTSILTFTTPPTEITYGLEKIFSPLKIFKLPINDIALIITLALRFIPSIITQGEKILKSQASRGIDYHNSNIKGKILAIKAMVIPLFILSFKRADELADAMELRLYNYSEKRTNYRLNKWSYIDTIILMSHVSIIILFVVSEVVL